MMTVSSGDLLAIFNAQRSAFRKGAPDYEDRLDALVRLERALIQRKDEVVAAVSEDFGGRAPQETLALDLFPLVNEIRYARKHLREWMAPRGVGVQWQFWPARAKIVCQPLGVVGILATWNYPLYLSLGPAVGALAAGNHVMVKPSEIAPQTAELMRRITAELYSPEYVAVITGSADIAAGFSQLSFDHLLFTGSARTAKLVMQAASENLTPLTLELGGKSPAIVHAEYSLVKAAERILTGKLYNAGQTCVAPDYVLIPRELNAQFRNIAKQVIPRMFPKLSANPDYTRIINVQQYRRLSTLVEESRAAGAEVITINPSGESCNEANRVFPPTLVFRVRDDMAVMQEEIFGPVLPIVLYGTLDEAIAYVNSRPHPLALYYFDNDAGRVNDVIARTIAGGVTINDCIFHVGQPGLPFGGVGPSGIGRYHGLAGFDTFSNRKGVFLQGSWSALSALRPPYGAKARRILNLMLRG
jgi:coniferyl-aldehyde dehydrogenase